MHAITHLDFYCQLNATQCFVVFATFACCNDFYHMCVGGFILFLPFTPYTITISSHWTLLDFRHFYQGINQSKVYHDC